MQCVNRTDFGDRCRFFGAEVIHAVRDAGSSRSGFAYKQLITGCGIRVGQNQLIKNHRPKVTCKVCLKGMKFEEKKPSNIRYVVEDISAKLFFKRLPRYETDWVEDAWNATQWKTYEGVRGKIDEIISARFYSLHGPVRHKKPMLWMVFYNHQRRNLVIRKIKLITEFVD